MKRKKLTKFIKKATSIIMYSVFLILLSFSIILIGYFIKIKVNLSKGIYEEPKYNAFIIISQSMSPTIKVNDAIITKKTSGKLLTIGDIITFISTDERFSGFTITHRIVGKEQNADGSYSFKTKGDNNNVVDSTVVNESNITGKVVLKIPMLGYLQYFLSTSFGWLIAVLIPCLSIIVYDFVILVEKVHVKDKNRVIKNKKVKRR